MKVPRLLLVVIVIKDLQNFTFFICFYLWNFPVKCNQITAHVYHHPPSIQPEQTVFRLHYHHSLTAVINSKPRNTTSVRWVIATIISTASRASSLSYFYWKVHCREPVRTIMECFTAPDVIRNVSRGKDIMTGAATLDNAVIYNMKMGYKCHNRYL